jgi:hypothetical protein
MAERRSRLREQLARYLRKAAEVQAELDALDPRKPVGKPWRAVVAPDGAEYPNLHRAAEAEGVTPTAIHLRVRRGRQGWRYVEPTT